MDDPGGADSAGTPPFPEKDLGREYSSAPPPLPLAGFGGDKAALSPGVQVDFDPDYGAGIATARFTEFCGWILIVILPVFAALAISSDAFGGNVGAGLVVVVGVACVGLVIIVMAQASRALLETANTNREILAVIKALSRGQTSQG